jgi:hypothetical protein
VVTAQVVVADEDAASTSKVTDSFLAGTITNVRLT